jgi:hypothetical protein
MHEINKGVEIMLRGRVKAKDARKIVSVIKTLTLFSKKYKFTFEIVREH